MDILLSDLRFAFRSLVRTKSSTASAVLCLALGIGINTSTFSGVYGMLLRPLPFRDAERLVSVNESRPQQGVRTLSVSWRNLEDWRAESGAFEDVAVFARHAMNLSSPGETPEHVNGATIGANLFPMLGITPIHGRVFLPEEDRPGGAKVTLISHALWERRYASSPRILGTTMHIDGAPHTVVGVMPARFKFPEWAEIWTPIAIDAASTTRGSRGLSVVARLAPGVDVARAQEKVVAVAKRLEAQYPETNRGWSASIESWRDSLVPRGVQAILIIQMFSVGFVLLIACANVANLMLVRGAARQRELAVRTAVGASRSRIVRQMLTESILIALMGGTLGVLIAMWSIDVMTSSVPIEIPWWIRMDVDGRVLAFTFTVSVLTALIFGLVPALRASRLNLVDVLKDGGRGSSEGPRGGRTRSILVAGEVAMSIVLLVGATLMIRSFLYLNRLDAGFDRSRLLTLQFTLSGDAYATARQRQSFFEQVLRRVEAAPGVTAATGASGLPLSTDWRSTSVAAEGKPLTPGEEAPASFVAVTPGFARAIGLPMLRGRDISGREATDSSAVILINEAVARTLWPGEDPVGRRLRLGRVADSEWLTVVGVVGNVREVYQIGGLDTKPALHVYAPYLRSPSRTMSMAVRTSGDPAAAAGAIRRAVAEVDPALPLFDVFTMDEFIARSVWTPKFYSQQFGLFAIIALVLAAVGLYGVISYAATRRTHEIGIRMALGARRGDILHLVLSQGMRPTLAGVGLGLVWALLVTRTLRSQIFGVSALDPLTYAGVALLLVTVSILATLLPARRASKTDPMVALRYE